VTENTDIRDRLAVERTRLANERTFLAYIRTALSLIAAAAVLFQFFSTDSSYIAVAWALAGCGILMLTVGVVRFFRVRAHLNAGIKQE
jgi:putative membrane protein